MVIIVIILTLVPRFMIVPNQTGFGMLECEVHQFFRGMLAGLAGIHVSPFSILQYTWMASLRLPSFGSIQYSPVIHWEKKSYLIYLTYTGMKVFFFYYIMYLTLDSDSRVAFLYILYMI